MSNDEARDVGRLEHTLAAFIRAFGLHQSEQTPCDINVSVSEAHTLVELHRTGGITQSALVNFLNLDKSTVSRLIKKLDKRDWLNCSPHPTDKRAQLLLLTPEGTKKAIQISKARHIKFEALTSALPKSKHDAVLSALTILTEAIHESEKVT